MVVKEVLPNDRYRVAHIHRSRRTMRQTKYDTIVAVDRMKPWHKLEELTDPKEDK